MRFEYETGINKKNFTKQCRCRVGIEIALLYNQALVLQKLIVKGKIHAHRLGCSGLASSQKQCIDQIAPTASSKRYDEFENGRRFQ